VAEGLAVTTSSPQVQSYRKIALELLLCERNHICSVCVSSGHCELQSLAQEHGVTYVRYPYNFPKLPVDTTHPRFVLDHNRCILCSRCVRTCAEIEGAHVWNVAGRGIQSKLVSELKRPWGEATSCTSCGKCVQSCPTGAMAEKGWGVEEMTKQPAVVGRLTSMRDGEGR
jgi:bidirectional [NiFe] hydrogenase diaphorase subunit